MLLEVQHPVQAQAKVLWSLLKYQTLVIDKRVQLPFSLSVIEIVSDRHCKALTKLYAPFPVVFYQNGHVIVETTSISFQDGYMLQSVGQVISITVLPRCCFREIAGIYVKQHHFHYPWRLLYPTLFNIFLEDITTHARDTYNGTISIGDRTITNLRFADDIDGITGEEDELATFVQNVDNAATHFCTEIYAEKPTIMTNNGTLQRDTTKPGQKMKTVDHFKYLGAIICGEGSRRVVLSRAALTIAALTSTREKPP